MRSWKKKHLVSSADPGPRQISTESVCLLAANAGPIAQRKGLTGLFGVTALRVKPALRLESHGLVEVLGIVCDGPGAGVDFYLSAS